MKKIIALLLSITCSEIAYPTFPSWIRVIHDKSERIATKLTFLNEEYPEQIPLNLNGTNEDKINELEEILFRVNHCGFNPCGDCFFKAGIFFCACGAFCLLSNMPHIAIVCCSSGGTYCSLGYCCGRHKYSDNDRIPEVCCIIPCFTCYK